MRHRTIRTALMTILAAAALLAAGCSSNANSSPGTTTPATTSSAASVPASTSAAASSPQQGSTASSGSAAVGSSASASDTSGSVTSGSVTSGSVTSGSAGTEDPAAFIASVMQRPTSINITEAVTGTIPQGKVIDYMQCGVPACKENGDALEAATSAVGWTLNRIDAGLTAETIKAAWDQAVAKHPDAVITSGVSRALFESELQDLAAAKVPVINLTTADPPGNGITAAYGYGPQWNTQGKILASYMLANAGSEKIDELSVTVSAYANLGMIADGLKAELTAHCTDCTTADLDVPVTSIGSDLPSRVTSYLSAHPNVNWVYLGFADMAPGLPAALKAADLGDVKVVTIDQTTTVASYIANGQSIVMSAGFDVHEMMWRAVDFLARTWTNSDTSQNTDVDGLPLFAFTKDNIPSTTEYFPYVADFENQYKKLWGVG